MELCPYKYNFSSFDRWFKLFLIKIGITSVASDALLIAWKGHLNRKCFVSSAPKLQRHLSEGISPKLWWSLWLLRGLKPNLSWNKKRIPVGSWILKILLLGGRKKCKKVSFEHVIRWYICEVFNKDIPRWYSIRKKAHHESFCSSLIIIERV